MGGGGENGHVNPGSARYVFPGVLDSHPLLWALVLTVRHGGWARSWIGSPGGVSGGRSEDRGNPAPT